MFHYRIHSHQCQVGLRWSLLEVIFESVCVFGGRTCSVFALVVDAAHFSTNLLVTVASELTLDTDSPLSVDIPFCCSPTSFLYRLDNRFLLLATCPAFSARPPLLTSSKVSRVSPGSVFHSTWSLSPRPVMD